MSFLLKAPIDIISLLFDYIDERTIIIITHCLGKNIGARLKEKINWKYFIEHRYPFFYGSMEMLDKAGDTVRFDSWGSKGNYKLYIDEECKAIYKLNHNFKRFYFLTKNAFVEKHWFRHIGICDSPEQFAKKFPKYKGKLYMFKYKRKKQPKKGGFRWDYTYYGEIKDKYEGTLDFISQADGTRGKPLIDYQWLFVKYPRTPYYRTHHPGIPTLYRVEFYFGTIKVKEKLDSGKYAFD